MHSACRDTFPRLPDVARHEASLRARCLRSRAVNNAHLGWRLTTLSASVRYRQFLPPVRRSTKKWERHGARSVRRSGAAPGRGAAPPGLAAAAWRRAPHRNRRAGRGCRAEAAAGVPQGRQAVLGRPALLCRRPVCAWPLPLSARPQALRRRLHPASRPLSPARRRSPATPIVPAEHRLLPCRSQAVLRELYPRHCVLHRCGLCRGVSVGPLPQWRL